MDINKAIITLEALASGCSPVTGEMIDHDSVMNEPGVITALQVAINHLKKTPSRSSQSIKISDGEIVASIELFKDQGLNPTANKLAGFFSGARRFKNEALVKNELYSRYGNVYQKGQLFDFFNQYFSGHNLRDRDQRYKDINFFRKETFNKLSDKAIRQLKGRVDALGIIKTDNLSEGTRHARRRYARAYEPWTEEEKYLLSKAILYTNDLDILSHCFQRGKSAIESCSKRIIYDSMVKKESP